MIVRTEAPPEMRLAISTWQLRQRRARLRRTLLYAVMLLLMALAAVHGLYHGWPL